VGFEKRCRSRGIAKKIGVVCHESEESILQKFAEMEERDRKLMEKASCEEKISQK